MQTDAENGTIQSDLLSDIDDNCNEPTIRSESFTMEELQQLEEMHQDDCELVFESVNNAFPALERNGTGIRNNLDWDFSDQTSQDLVSLPTTQHSHTIITKRIHAPWALNTTITRKNDHHPKDLLITQDSTAHACDINTVWASHQ